MHRYRYLFSNGLGHTTCTQHSILSTPSMRLLQVRTEGCGVWTAGVIFWQFGFAPYVSNSIFGKCRHCQAIQISASDSVFQNVIAPAALQASRLSKSAQKVARCTPGEPVDDQAYSGLESYWKREEECH